MRTLLAAAVGALLLAACAAGEPEPPCESRGCDSAWLCDLPIDPAQGGPWPVGSREMDLGALHLEIWYPAAFGSEQGLAPKRYRISDTLPVDEQAKIPEGESPVQDCDCYAELPMDTKRGPYPAIIFVHGTAGFRTQNLSQMTHWASRGFVVLAADHPGLKLADALDFQVDADLEGDLAALLELLTDPGGDAAFLDGQVDAQRVGLAGHSAGGSAIASFSDHPQVKVIIPMAYEGVLPGEQVEQVLVMGALDDQVVAYERQVEGYESSPSPKALVGLGNAGHLAFSDLCAITNGAGQDLVEMAVAYEIKNAELAGLLWDGCESDQLQAPESSHIIKALATVAFERVLQCRDQSPALGDLVPTLTGIEDFREEG